MNRASRNAYDHRLRQAIVETGNPDLFPELSIPDSTRRTWLRRGLTEVVSFDRADADVIELRATISKLNQRIAILTALVRLLVVWTRVNGLSLERTRVASAKTKNKILRAVAGAERVISRTAALKVIGSDADISQMAQHVVAQVDIAQSNSLVERLWYQLRHRWLYLHQLDSFVALEKLIATYFNDHNHRIPLQALGGRTPDEAYYRREVDLPERLAGQHRAARQNRVQVNRALSCTACSSSGSVETNGHAFVDVHPGSVR